MLFMHVLSFFRVADFEFTPECVVFDILNIHLYHGWLVDPQNVEYKAAIGNLSYNQLVEKVVASKESNAESHLASQGEWPTVLNTQLYNEENLNTVQ